MPTKTAAIRINLNYGSFQAGMRKLRTDVQKTGERMGRDLEKPLTKGMNSMKRSLAGMGSQLKNTIKNVARIGGTLATGLLVRDAMQLQKTYRDISFLVNRVPGQALKWQDVQKLVTKAADQTGQSSENMAAAFKEVYSATGNLQYTKDSLEMIGRVATASGKSTAEIATVAHMLKRKWGASAGDMESMMVRFIEKLDRGGLGIDQLSSRFDLVAGEAEAAGMRGERGISQLFGMMEKLDARMGAGMAARGMKTLFQYTKTGTTQMERFEKAGKIKFEPDSTPFEKIRQILEDPKMRSLTMKVFTEMAGTTFEEIARPFYAAYETTMKEKQDEKAAIEAGLTAYDKFIKSTEESHYTIEKLNKQFQERVRRDPAVQMTKALNKVRDAFAQPKMIDALTKFASNLPPLADAVAKFLDYILDHPVTAVAGAGAMKAGGAFAAGALPAMMRNMMYGAGPVGSGGGGGKAPPAPAPGVPAPGGPGGELTRFGKALNFATVGLGTFAAAFAVGSVLYENVIKPLQAKQAEERGAREAEGRQVAITGVSIADRAGTVEQKRKALEDTRKELKQLREKTTSVILSDDQRMGQVLDIFTDIQTPLEQHQDAIKKLETAESILVSSLTKRRIAEDEQRRAAERMTEAMRKSVDYFEDWTRGPAELDAIEPGAKKPEKTKRGYRFKHKR